jgi:hypothetical protein
MGTLEKVSFTIASLGLVLSLGIAKRVRRKKSSSAADLREFLDWVDVNGDLPDGSENGFLTPREEPTSPSTATDNVLYRSLASVGLVPTSPRQSRGPRQLKSDRVSPHPASGNDEIADDVVRVQRVSEEEEAERYFSSFSYYNS